MVQMLTSNRSRSDAHRTALFMSDGHSNVNRQNTIPNAIRLRQTVSVVIVFGIGSHIGWNEMEGIASDPHNYTVFVVGSYSQLPSILDRLLQSTTDCKMWHIKSSDGQLTKK